MNTGSLAKTFGGIIEEVMTASSKDVEIIIGNLIITD